MPIIAAEDATRRYVMGETVLSALDGVTLTIEEGEFVAIVGRSGSGKTTLLNLMGGLDRPTGGELFAGDLRLSELSDDELADYRRDKVGFVFQFFNLLAGRSAQLNVEMPLMIAGLGAAERASRAGDLLEQVGLGARSVHKPDELSGGEQQRVSIARALAHDPPLLLADEPTGNLDTKTANEILGLMKRLNTEQKKTIIMVTHDPTMAADVITRQISLSDGKVVGDERR